MKAYLCRGAALLTVVLWGAGCGYMWGSLNVKGETASPYLSLSWQFVDGDAATGLNFNTAWPAGYNGGQVLTTFQGKLYAAWAEENTSYIDQIHVRVYNGDDASPSWSAVDGGASNGLNYNPGYSGDKVSLIDFNSKLYATWSENNSSFKNQIRMAVYNGNDTSPSWSFVDGGSANGINYSTSEWAIDPIFVVFGSKLYLAWDEYNGTASQIRVAVYNGNDGAPSWTFVDGNPPSSTGINYAPSSPATGPQLVALNNKLYAAWTEDDGGTNEIRVAVYNGNDGAPSWTFVDHNPATSIGLNYNSTTFADEPSLLAFNSNLYVSWFEGSGQIRVAQYNGQDASPSWAFIDGGGSLGINKNPSEAASHVALFSYDAQLFAAWDEDNTGSGGCLSSGGNCELRVAAYDGSTWYFVDGNSPTSGLNWKSSEDTWGNDVTITPGTAVLGSELYLIWNENPTTTLCDGSGGNCQIRVIRATLQ